MRKYYARRRHQTPHRHRPGHPGGQGAHPKSQVEQITIALIYKFMDDLDAESEELGGQRRFFADGFARYGWAGLMRPGLGGTRP